MSLVVYVGIDKFKAESGAALREQNATELTLSDIAKGQPSTDEASTVEDQLLVIDMFSEEALASLKSWLKKETAHACIIAWPQPVAWLAASLATGTTGEEALSDWLSQAKRLLALFRSARRQVTLAGYMPGCELEVIKAPVIDRSENPIYQLAAAYLSSQSQALQDTYAYLAASSKECPVVEAREAEMAQAALSEYHARQAESEQGQRNGRALKEADAAQERQQQDIARLKGELSSTHDEYALVLQQLQNTQEFLAEGINDLQTLKKENEALKQAFDTQRKEKDVTQQHNQVLKKENEALGQASDTLKMNVETQRKEQSAIQQHVQTLQKENQTLKQVLETEQKDQAVILQALQNVQIEAAEIFDMLQQVRATDFEHREQAIAQQELTAAQNVQLLSTLQEAQQAYETLYVEQQALSEQLFTVYPQNQQELEKNASEQITLRQQLEKRQTELNVLRTESEQRIHRLERLVQWLRVHAQRHAAVAYREIRSYKKALPSQVAMLEASPLFDAEWYCKQYPDVAQANIKPAEHFIKFGAIDGRHPGPLFSTEFYLTHYEDVAASGQHPLLHYLRYGKEENREIHPPQYQLSALQTIAKGAKA